MFGSGFSQLLNGPPNPTSAYVRAARRDGQLIDAICAGRNLDEIAADFGLTGAAAVQRKLRAVRDRTRPPDIIGGLEVEIRDAERLMGHLHHRVRPADVSHRHQPVWSTFRELASHTADLLAVSRTVGPSQGRNLAECTGRWTPLLEARRLGWTFERIAAAAHIADEFDASLTVADELEAYTCAGVGRLRRNQIDELDCRLAPLWPAATRASSLDLGAIRSTTRLLRRRASVRGLFVAEGDPDALFSSEPVRWSDATVVCFCVGADQPGRRADDRSPGELGDSIPTLGPLNEALQ